MRGNEFLDKMELIDPAYVEAADAEPNNKKEKNIWIKCGAIAACIALVIYAGTRLFSQESPGNTSSLPMLSVSEDESGFGYEGYMVYDISELVSGNPWSEDLKLSTLPVYKNPLTYEGDGIISGADFDKMRDFLLEVAVRLGLDADKLTVTDDSPDEETKQRIIEEWQELGATVPDGYFNPTSLTVKADGLRIQVNQSMTATVFFEPALSLPEGYNFTPYASYDDTLAVAEYLKTEYKDFIGIDNPQVNICGGDYDIYARQSYYIEFFDASGNETEQIINCNFNRVVFHCDEDGKLFMASIDRPDLSEKVGDYPIITLDEAEELLLNGNYVTSVPCEFPGKEYVKKAELIYRTGLFAEYYMPYYRFYVELPGEERENGLKTYGAYYVPAVESAYISDMPTWNGNFN